METTTTGQSDARDPAPGRLALVQELVNTRELDVDGEELTDLEALESWLRERDLLGEHETLRPGDLERAHAFREALRSLLEEHAHPTDTADAVVTLNTIAAGGLLRVRFTPSGKPVLEPAGYGLDCALAELLSIIECAGYEGTWPRLKVCADETCRWAFYDRSKNRSGNWCSMAVCGNRAKARSFRARRRDTAKAPTAPH